VCPDPADRSTRIRPSRCSYLAARRRTAFTAGVSGAAWLSAIAAGVLYYGVAFWFYVTASGVERGPGGIFINLIPGIRPRRELRDLGETAPRSPVDRPQRS